ncbi:S8 family serine peptidase [Bacillus massiliigorillae]|uniref:S8 family serine peptidase n=1 Tax=Bacillus massiliigorillae TaxID=1243664 RepID=UPI0003A9A415|nr:S8 family serine peptidase [Bacillus massiliigorillae]
MNSKLFKSVTATSVVITATMPLGLIASADEVENQDGLKGGNASNEFNSVKVSQEQIIVKYKDINTLNNMKANQNVKQLGGELIAKENDIVLYKVPKENIDTTLEALKEMANVDYAEKNITYSIEGVNDTYYENQWNLSSVGAQTAWEMLKGEDKGAVVAVLDTGVQGSHVDLDGRVLEEATFVDGYDESYQGDDQGHGTFVSGLIAANTNNAKGIAGVAGTGDVKILPVKVMNKSGIGDAFSIAKGIEYAIEKEVDVINLSISGEYSEAIEQAINKAHDAGIVVVAAAGNGGGNADTSYPAALPNVISVGAIAAKDQVYNGSNYGSTLDLVAPGVSVISTAISGDLGDENGYYKTGTGTSYAAPHVSAIAALYKIQNPTASASEIEVALTSTATDLNEEGWDEKTGFGKVNAAAALAGNIDIEPLSFTLPKVNENVINKTTIQVSLNNTAEVETTKFFVDTITEANLIDEVKGDATTATIDWDTTKITDGKHSIIAATYRTDGTVLNQVSREVTVRNQAQSGYMFSVKTPNNTIAKGAQVQLFDKVVGEDGQYSYSSLWSGVTNSEGVVRVPSNIGTDLKSLKVVVQGKFDAANGGNTWFMYSREVNGKGTIELDSDDTKAVTLNTLDENSKNVDKAQYFITMKDEKGIEITSTKKINEENALESPTIYVDEGAYNVYSYYKEEGNTYFLTNTDVAVTKETSALIFDSRDVGEVSLDDTGKLENAVLYLYNDSVSEILGSSEVLTGRKFFVTAGEYNYMIDAEVKGNNGEKNWVYVFANNKKQAVVKKGEKRAIKAGESLEISELLPDQDSLKRYYTQRGLTYIQRENPYIAYKLDGAVYTKQAFSDAYDNKLVGMYRGSIESTNALYKKNATTGETIIMDEENEVAAINFGDIYPIYQVKRKQDNVIMLNSYDKNPTNPANRSYYFYSFWVPNSSTVTAGKYEISLKLNPSPLAPEGLEKEMTIDMQDSGVNLSLQDNQGKNVATYVTINRVEKDAHGDYKWVQAFGRNSDATSKILSIPSNLEVSKEKGGNVAIIRYTTSTGEFGYLFRQFTDLEELSNKMTIPTDMQKVSISAMKGNEKLDGVSSKLWMIKQPVTVSGTTVYPTANNLQNYTKDAIYLEPGSFVIEGNYVTLPNAEGEKSNYYFLDNNVEIKPGEENKVIFNTDKLVEIMIDADTAGFKDVRGAILYPYNKYSTEFIKTLRVGHKFYVPSNLEMDLQVQLGYGDPESNNYIWNYFLSKGTQEFKSSEKVNWRVGGDFQAFITIDDNKLEKGELLSAKTSIQDSFGNTISSVLVNTTSDYSIATNQDVAYERLSNGQIIEKIISKDSGQYLISHSGIPEANAASVKPFVRIYDEKGSKVFENASLDYYRFAKDLDVSLQAGKYRAELAMATSPKGAILSSKSDGLFTVLDEQSNQTNPPSTGGNESTNPPSTGGNESTNPPSTGGNESTNPPSTGGNESTNPPSTGGNESTNPPSTGGNESTNPPSTGGNESTNPPSEEKPDGENTNESWSSENLTASMLETTNGYTYTFSEKQLEIIRKSEKNVVTLSTKQGYIIEILKDDFNVGDAGSLSIRLVVKGNKLSFEAFTKEQSIIFKNYVSIILPKEKVDVGLNQAVVLREGTKGLEAVPHLVTKEGILLKLKHGGNFIIRTNNVSFADSMKDPHRNYIESLAKRCIVQGKSIQKFDPTGNMTRAEFSVMVARALDLKSTSQSLFKDVKGKWFEDAVQALYEAGIVKGVNSTTFKPNETITRLQAALMLSNILDYVKLDVKNVDSSIKSFKDISKIKKEEQKVIERLHALEIFVGKKDGTFGPYEQLTRSQMAKTLYKSLEIAGML